jgi:hypothetical protein
MGRTARPQYAAAAPATPAAPVATDPTTAVTTLIKRSRSEDVMRLQKAAAGAGAYKNQSLLGTGIR